MVDDLDSGQHNQLSPVGHTHMKTQETTRPSSKSRKPQWVRDCQQLLVRFFGGYTKDDLKEAVKISYAMGEDTTGHDMIDVCAWHWNKFGTRYDA